MSQSRRLEVQNQRVTLFPTGLGENVLLPLLILGVPAIPGAPRPVDMSLQSHSCLLSACLHIILTSCVSASVSKFSFY